VRQGTNALTPRAERTDCPIFHLRSPPESPKRPVVIGVNWYVEFDTPEPDEQTGEHFIARGGADSLTQIRGGHCVCLEPGGEPDPEEWWNFYDQGSEGACVGFGWSRCQSILNKELYGARWLWDRSKEIDQWPETNPGDNNGTSVRSAGDVLAKSGHVDWVAEYADDDHTEPSVSTTNPAPTTASRGSAGRGRSRTFIACSGTTGPTSLAPYRFSTRGAPTTRTGRGCPTTCWIA